MSRFVLSTAIVWLCVFGSNEGHAQDTVALEQEVGAVEAPAESSSSTDLAAQRRYEQGLALFEQRRFAEALEIMRSVAAQTRSPNARLAAGRCLQELGREVEAYVELELAVAYANLQVASGRDVYALTREEAAARAATLRPRLGFVIVTVEPRPSSAAMHVGELPFRETALGVALPVTPRSLTVISLRVPGFEEARVEVRVAAGETRTVALTPTPSPDTVALTPTPSPDPVENVEAVERRGLARLGWTAGALGVATGVSFVGLHVVTDRHFDDLSARCPMGICDFDPSAETARGNRLQAATNAMWVAATTLVLTSVIALIVDAIRD